MSASASVVEDGQGLFKLGQVVWTDEDRGSAVVARDKDPLVLMLNAVDGLGQVVADSL